MLLIIVREQMYRAAVSWLDRFVQLRGSDFVFPARIFFFVFSWICTIFYVIYKSEISVSLIRDINEGTWYQSKHWTHLLSIIFLILGLFPHFKTLENYTMTKSVSRFCVYGWHAQYFKILLIRYTLQSYINEILYIHSFGVVQDFDWYWMWQMKYCILLSFTRSANINLYCS